MSLHIPGSMCVGVTLWFGLGGVVSICRLKHCWSIHVECVGLYFISSFLQFSCVTVFSKYLKCHFFFKEFIACTRI